MKPSDPDSPSERRLAEALRAALQPRPPGAPPERVSDDFFDQAERFARLHIPLHYRQDREAGFSLHAQLFIAHRLIAVST